MSSLTCKNTTESSPPVQQENETSIAFSGKQKRSHMNNATRRRIEPVRYKTRICKHFMETGMCPFIPRCAFAHGQHELRTIQNNAINGLTHLSRLKEYQSSSEYSPNDNHNLNSNPIESSVYGSPENGYQVGCNCPECVHNEQMYMSYHPPHHFMYSRQRPYAQRYQNQPYNSCNECMFYQDNVVQP